MAVGRLLRCSRALLNDAGFKVIRATLLPGWMHSCLGAKRHLLSEDVIRLTDFQQKKLQALQLLPGSPRDYINTLNQKLQSKTMIVRDELKVLLHLCESPDDMVTIRDVIYRYHADNRNLAFGEFRFGPLFMRQCYELGLEEMAAATITDERMKGFFCDSTSFNITIDLLFTKGSYDKALEVLNSMKKQGVPFNKDTYILAIATCYKMNMPQSLNVCMALIEEGQSTGSCINRRCYLFAVALALQQNDIEKAQLLFSKIVNTDSHVCRTLKVALLIKSGAIQDAISMLSEALQYSPFVKTPKVCRDVIDLLRLRCEATEHETKAEKLLSQLEQTDQVTLDEMLCCTLKSRSDLAHFHKERRLSRRTRQPLQSTLLSE